MILLAVISCFLNCLICDCRLLTGEDIQLNIQCYEKKLDTIFTVTNTEENMVHVKYRTTHVSLIDTTCKGSANSTSKETPTSNAVVKITSSYNECGTRIQQSDAKITITNSATLTITDALRDKGLAKRVSVYKYDIVCQLQRAKGISTGTVAINEKPINFTVDFSLDLYTDNAFQNKLSSKTLTVDRNQLIYVKINENSRNKDVKFIVTKCVATKTRNLNDVNFETFFKDGCALDNTFRVRASGGHSFAFQIETFNFIQYKLSAYFQCELYVCEANTNADDCTQQCRIGEIPGVSPSSGRLKKFLVISKNILYNIQITCTDISCPDNSLCVPVLPAYCECNQGFIFSRVEETCTKLRHVEVSDVVLDQTWNPKFSDATSMEFRLFAKEQEDLLYRAFKVTHSSNIEGVKVLSAREGSIILDTSIIYAKTVTPEVAYNTFVKALTSDSLESTNTLRDLKVSAKRLPPLKPVVQTTNDNEKLTLVIAILAAMSVLLLAALLIFTVRRIKQENRAIYDCQF